MVSTGDASTNEQPQVSISTEIPVQGRSAKVDLPHQYLNWRDYAFSEFPEDRDSHEA